MAVIGINGSGRTGGNTSQYVQEVLAGAGEAGAETELFHLAGMKISGCNGCMGCKKDAKCVIKDDMGLIYDAIAAAGDVKALVIGTPIYFDHVSAQLKAWIDRLFCYRRTELGLKMFPKGFQAVLIGTWDVKRAEAYAPVMEWLASRVADYHDIETVATLVLPNASAVPLSERSDLIEKAREVGRMLTGR